MDDDLNDPRETDYQVKGYTFSEPFHLIVSYGKVLGRPNQCPKLLLLAPQPTQESDPLRKLAIA